jgi:hypothetical protein
MGTNMCRHGVEAFFPAFLNVFYIRQEFDATPIYVSSLLVEKAIAISFHQSILFFNRDEFDLIF